MKHPRVPGLVSVIIPIFNADLFLQEAVDSVLAQTYTHWELLLVDDGSTDQSTAMARRISDSDPTRIRYFEHPEHRNLGVCSTRNLGIERSRGAYVAFLDADDLWLPEKLSQQVGLMEAHGEVAALFGHSIYFEQGQEAASNTIPPLAPGGKVYRPPELLKLTYPLGVAGAPCPSSLLMRYEALEEIGGFEESFNRMQVYEDQVFLSKVYLNLAVYVSEESWDRYRCHENSCWTRARREGTEPGMREAYVLWLQAYLRQKNVSDREIWKAVRRVGWSSRYPLLARARGMLRRAARRAFRVHSSGL